MQKRCVTFLQGDATSTVVLVDTRKELVHSSVYPAARRLRWLMQRAAAETLVLILFVRNMIWFLSPQASADGFGFSVLKARL